MNDVEQAGGILGNVFPQRAGRHDLVVGEQSADCLHQQARKHRHD